MNATGGEQRYEQAPPAVILKGVGIDLTAAGRVEPVDGDEVIVAPTGDRYAYSKLLVAGGELVGGLVLGRPADSPRLISAVKRRMHVGDRLDALRAGDSSALDATAPVRAGRQEASATP